MRSLTTAVLAGIVGMALLCAPSAGCDGATIDFDASTYNVTAGQEFSVGVKVAPAAFPDGLLSMGIALAFDPALAEIVSISIASDLNNDGTGAAGLRQFGAGFGKAAGFYTGADGYTGSTLVTFTLRNLATTGDYPLMLGFYDSTPSFANFIDAGSYSNVDSSITFGTATVVVPEPLTVSLLALGGIVLKRRRARY